MKKTKPLYHGHRYPAVVISCAVRWYLRFQLSLRDIEELLLETAPKRGLCRDIVSVLVARERRIPSPEA